MAPSLLADVTTESVAVLDRPLPVATMPPYSTFDSATGCTLTMAEPAANPELFATYHAGAVASYRRFGVTDALDGDVDNCAADTALFWVMTDAAGELVGGVRAKGPLRRSIDSHALVEWAGQPGEDAVRAMLADRIPLGVIEMKSAWLSPDRSEGPRRAKLIARSGFHGLAALGITYCMATSAAHILEQWRSSGGVVAAIPATPYPDERYQTKMMWWDRRTFGEHGQAAQVTTIRREMAEVGFALRRSTFANTAVPVPAELAPTG